MQNKSTWMRIKQFYDEHETTNLTVDVGKNVVKSVQNIVSIWLNICYKSLIIFGQMYSCIF